jgi:hypothetical protein
MPQVLILTEAGLMHQCLSPRRISKRSCRLPTLRPHFSNGYLCCTSDPGILRDCRDSPVRKSDVHTHHRSVIDVMAMFHQLLT